MRLKTDQTGRANGEDDVIRLPDRMRANRKGIAGSLSRTFHSGLPRRTANEISRFPMDIHLVRSRSGLFASHVRRNGLRIVSEGIVFGKIGHSVDE